ncbi:MAG: hypothetical protein E6H90_15475, partial [Chloroflexi bacterium]
MNRSESTFFALVGALAGLVPLVGCDGSRPVAPALEPAATYASRQTLTGPSSPTAVAMSETRIDVSWQDNSNDESGF